MRHERDRNKLKFYKGEYIGFDMARKAFESDKNDMQKEINARDKRFNDLQDQYKRLEEQLKLAET